MRHVLVSSGAQHAHLAGQGRSREHGVTHGMSTAVCVTGEFRTATCRPRMPLGTKTTLTPLESLRVNVLAHLGNHDVFAVLSGPSDLAPAVTQQLHPTSLVWDQPINASSSAYQSHLSEAGMRFRLQVNAFAQARKLHLCWQSVTAREWNLGTTYTHVLRTRPDMLILRPLNLTELMRSAWATPRCVHRKSGICVRHAPPVPSLVYLAGVPGNDKSVGVDVCLRARQPGAATSCVGPCPTPAHKSSSRNGNGEAAKGGDGVEGADLLGFGPWSGQKLLFNDVFYMARRHLAERLFNHLSHLGTIRPGGPRLTACSACGKAPRGATACADRDSIRLGLPAQNWVYSLRVNDSRCHNGFEDNPTAMFHHECLLSHMVPHLLSASIPTEHQQNFPSGQLRLRLFNGDIAMKILRNTGGDGGGGVGRLGGKRHGLGDAFCATDRQADRETRNLSRGRPYRSSGGLARLPVTKRRPHTHPNRRKSMPPSPPPSPPRAPLQHTPLVEPKLLPRRNAWRNFVGLPSLLGTGALLLLLLVAAANAPRPFCLLHRS